MLLQVASKKETLKNVTNYIADVICKRGELGYNYGVILIPEGLIDFIPEVTPSSGLYQLLDAGVLLADAGDTIKKSVLT